MELGHWVTGSMGHLGHLSCPGHPVIISTRCETRVFPVFEKMPKRQNVHLKCWNDKSHRRCLLLDWNPCNELLLLPMIIKKFLAWEYFFTHKSKIWSPLYNRVTGSIGSPRVAGFPGHWVTKCDPVPSLLPCSRSVSTVTTTRCLYAYVTSTARIVCGAASM